MNVSIPVVSVVMLNLAYLVVGVVVVEVVVVSGIGNGAALGGLNPLPGNVVNNGTLQFNHTDALTFGGAVSGSGGLSKLAGGSLTLTSTNNTYTGTTTVEAGTLTLGGANALPVTASAGDVRPAGNA